MPDPNLVRINGTPYSWTSCAHFFQGIPYKGLTSVTYKETREVKLVYGAQQDGTPIGMTSGAYKVENVSFTMLRSSALGLMADLTAFGLGSFGDAQFNYVLQLFEPAALALAVPEIPASTIISGCRITGVEDKHEQGVDELVTEFTCQAGFVVRNVAGIPMQLWSTIRTALP